MKHIAFSGLALIGLLWSACVTAAPAAPPDTLTLQALVNRPDHWPATVSLVGTFKFGNGMTIHPSDKLRVASFDGTLLKLIGPGNALLNVRAQDSNLLDAANQAWAALTPAQRAIDPDAVIADQSLWPVETAVTTGINCSYGRLPPGTNLAVVSVSKKGVDLGWPNSPNRLNMDVANTDVIARARQLVLIDPDKRPSRLAAALQPVLVDANGKPYHDDHLGDKKIFAIYYGAGWCPPCVAFSPDLVKFLNEAMPAHPELAAVYLSDDKQPADMFAYMQKENMPFPGVRLNDLVRSPVLSAYIVEIVPHLVIVDRFGNVLASNQDSQGNRYDLNDTLAALKKLLATQPPSRKSLDQAKTALNVCMALGGRHQTLNIMA